LITRIYRELKKLNSPQINEPMKKWANELNTDFPKKEVQMVKKHRKNCSTYLVIKEMQIKTALRFHCTPVRMANIKNKDNKCWQGYGFKGTLKYCSWLCKLVHPLWKTV
jgi:hypothetical protein